MQSRSQSTFNQDGREDTLKTIIKNEQGNSLLENIIILPLIFIIIYALIMTAFVLHDRSTLEAAAKRGAIYASHCISNPNYENILNKSGNQKGKLDTSIEASSQLSFSGIGKNIQPYRYITGSTTSNLKSKVEQEVMAIIAETKISWREVEASDVSCEAKNCLLYHDITVSIDGKYPIPRFFSLIGLDENFTYTVTAKMISNDPDEFIRNADLVVNLITKVDEMTGGYLDKAKKRIAGLAEKLVEWISVSK